VVIVIVCSNVFLLQEREPQLQRKLGSNMSKVEAGSIRVSFGSI